MRLIDADALIEFLDAGHLRPPTELCFSELSMKNIIDLMPTIEQPHWIPCKERLPEEGQACLVSDRGTILIDTYIGHGNPYNWRWYLRDYEAWMPLPEPYREGKE